MKTNNYDFIAPWYDRLSRMVFFKAQVNAQKDQLSFIDCKQQILIVGGGTGWILEEIGKAHQDLQITYVEISEKMLAIAKKKNYGKNYVDFIQLPIEEYADQKTYDLVLTAFLFDNFKADRAELVFNNLHQKLKKEGFWLFSDFSEHYKTNYWQNFLLKVMYFFFSKVANIEAKGLINMDSYFSSKKYEIAQEKYYYKSFIKAIVFRKT